jgi:hypothetical protein
MNSIFKDLIDDYVIIYLDDILIFSQNKEDHTKHIQEVLQRLRRNNLFCKPEKCQFFQEQVEYLGHIIQHNQVEMDPGKVAAVVD